MKAKFYTTSAAMLADHPDIQAAAIRYKLTRLLGSEAEAAAEAGLTVLPLIAQWDRLKAAEGTQAAKAQRQADRQNAVDRQQMKAARRREAAACPALLPLKA